MNKQKKNIRLPVNGGLLHDLLKHTNQSDIAKRHGMSRQALAEVYSDDRIRPRLFSKLADEFEWSEKTVKALLESKKVEFPRSMHIEFGF